MSSRYCPNCGKPKIIDSELCLECNIKRNEAQKQIIDQPKADPVNHPKHYTSHPSGIEAIQICEHYGFNLGNSIKYIWRAGLKDDIVQDLEKARWYLDREIQKRKAARALNAVEDRI